MDTHVEVRIETTVSFFSCRRRVERSGSPPPITVDPEILRETLRCELLETPQYVCRTESGRVHRVIVTEYT